MSERRNGCVISAVIWAFCVLFLYFYSTYLQCVCTSCSIIRFNIGENSPVFGKHWVNLLIKLCFLMSKCRLPVSSNWKETDTSSSWTVPSTLLIQTCLGRVSLWGDVGTTAEGRLVTGGAVITAAPLLNAGGPDTAQAEAARYPQTSGQHLGVTVCLILWLHQAFSDFISYCPFSTRRMLEEKQNYFLICLLLWLIF